MAIQMRRRAPARLAAPGLWLAAMLIGGCMSSSPPVALGVGSDEEPAPAMIETVLDLSDEAAAPIAADDPIASTAAPTQPTDETLASADGIDLIGPQLPATANLDQASDDLIGPPAPSQLALAQQAGSPPGAATAPQTVAGSQASADGPAGQGVGFFARLFSRAEPSGGASPGDGPSPQAQGRPLLALMTDGGQAQSGNGQAALPGVRGASGLLGINEGAETGEEIQVASAAGLARLAPNGVAVQHDGVQVACLRPEVIEILKVVERHYGKKPVVTSGYRSPKLNRRAGGARNSMHIYCRAVDIQVEGVSKWDLAKFLRTVPGRGGVGTYCRTRSVHLDTGPRRDWHHPCRRKTRARSKA